MSGVQNKKTTTSIRFKYAEWIFVNLPFVCYLALLGVLMIFNNHASEKSLREIDSLKREVKDLRWQHMNLEQKLMYGSTQSQLTKNLGDKELKPLGNLPKKLSISSDTDEK